MILGDSFGGTIARASALTAHQSRAGIRHPRIWQDFASTEEGDER